MDRVGESTEVENGTPVQVPYHRRAILTGGGPATRLLGWRRKAGAMGFSPNRCREVFRRQPKSVLQELSALGIKHRMDPTIADRIGTDTRNIIIRDFIIREADWLTSKGARRRTEEVILGADRNTIRDCLLTHCCRSSRSPPDYPRSRLHTTIASVFVMCPVK
jgi:hypothetical protein